MSNILTTFVDNNRHWTRENMGDIIIAKSLDRAIWRHDYVYVQLFIAADEDAEIDVQTHGGDGMNVELFSLDSTMAFIGHAGWYARNPRGIMPVGPKVKVNDILSPFEPFNMRAGDVKCVFVKISSSDVVGLRKVYLDVYDHDILSSTLCASINVLPIDMPMPCDYAFKVEYWQHPYNVAEYYDVEPWSDEHLDILRSHQRLYKALGGEAVTCTMLDEVWGGQTYSKHEIRYPSMIEWIYDRGHWRFDYTAFDRWVDLNIELGLGTKFVCYSMMPWGGHMRYYNASKKKHVDRRVSTMFKGRYKRAWSVFLEDFIAHLDKKGIFDSVYIGFDERSNMGMILDFLSTFKNKDGHSFKVSASFNDYMGNRACLDRIDSASVGLDEIKAHEDEYSRIVEERSAEGKYTTMYTATEHFPNSFALSMPCESYWSIMYARSTGNNGFLRWAYDAWVEDPLKDATHWSFQAGDCFLIYPAHRGHEPLWSYRLVMLDEGVRDVNKLAILSQNTELAGEISKIYAFARKDYTYRETYDPRWGVAIRRAKWADAEAQNDIPNDVNAIKRGIAELTRRYLVEKPGI